MSFIKKILPRSLFGRSLMIIVTPAVLLQLILMVVFLDNHWKKMTMRYSESVAGEVALIVENYKIHRQSAVLPKSLKSYLRMEVTLEKRDIEEHKVQAQGIWQEWVVEFLDDALKEHISDPYEVIYDSRENLVNVHVDVGRRTIAIQFPDRRIFTSSSYIFLLWMVSSAIILSFISIWFMRNQVRPIRKLAVAADRFGRGLEAGSFKPSGAREVRQASHAFLVMRDRLQRQMDQRTTMLAGISHDLRTPLTRLKLGLSMLENSDDAKDMKRDIDDMERMINGYLEFVRGEGDEAIEQVDITHLINHVLSAYKDDQDRLIFEAPQKDMLISVRPLAIERALGNVVKNALKYAQNVNISILKDDDHISIIIEDDGDGIPEDQYEDVFKAFYRLDKARNSQTGGIGLGMTITKDLILSHGGDVTLDKSGYGGLKVTVSLPV